MLTGTNPRLLWKFTYNGAWKGMRSVQRFKKRLRRGEHFPAFVFVSPTNRCNLSCQGCWVTRTDPPVHLDQAVFERIISECKAEGCSFFGVLGGEPLLYPGIFDVLAWHPDCYFQLFTNGTLVDAEAAAAMRRLGNVSPLVSIEGLDHAGDIRRGGKSVSARSMAGVSRCVENGLVTGVATSVCRSNIDDLVSERFVRQLIDLGVHYLWYYIYRPVGADPCPDLALGEEDIVRLRRFMVEARTRYAIVIIDAYWDHDGRALCPAATGISHHIGPGGEIEPCPPIQFCAETAHDEGDLAAVFGKSDFLRAFSTRASELTRGCILLEHPGELKTLVEENGARPTSGREDALAELDRMQPMPGHDMSGREIPEKSWMYRFAKRNWFFGFGAYG